jgi:hypothetical protein
MSLCTSLTLNLHRRRESTQTHVPPGALLDSRQIAEYQFEQRHNERETAVCLIRATQDRSPETPMSPGGIFDCCIISLAPAEQYSIRLLDEALPASCCCQMTAHPGNEPRKGYQLRAQLTRTA